MNKYTDLVSQKEIKMQAIEISNKFEFKIKFTAKYKESNSSLRQTKVRIFRSNN
jgi:hypothetical protein